MESLTPTVTPTSPPINPIPPIPKIIPIAFIVIGALALMLTIFQIGSIVGARRAQFACQWDKNYGPLFGVPPEGMSFRAPPMPDANGASGMVLQVRQHTLIIRSHEGMEKSILIPEDIIIRRGNDQIPLQAIAPEDRLVIFGTPTEQGQLYAKFIRVLPSNR